MKILVFKLVILEIQGQHNQLQNRQVWSMRSNAFNTQSPGLKTSLSRKETATDSGQLRCHCLSLLESSFDLGVANQDARKAVPDARLEMLAAHFRHHSVR
jgi:hypothetical protein